VGILKTGKCALLECAAEVAMEAQEEATWNDPAKYAIMESNLEADAESAVDRATELEAERNPPRFG